MCLGPVPPVRAGNAPFPESSIVLADRDAEQAHLAKLGPHLVGERIRLVHVGCDRRNLFLRELGDRFPQLRAIVFKVASRDNVLEGSGVQ